MHARRPTRAEIANTRVVTLSIQTSDMLAVSNQLAAAFPGTDLMIILQALSNSNTYASPLEHYRLFNLHKQQSLVFLRLLFLLNLFLLRHKLLLLHNQ